MNYRKQQVLLTAQRLFVEKGFVATSVQDILETAKISKGTFYNYFSSKNECLISILEHIQTVAAIRIRELLVGQDISSKDIFVKQILAHLQVNQEHHLFLLFESIFHSKDQELRGYLKNLHMKELAWLAKRLVNIYGKDVTKYAPDCAVLLVGMLRHMTYVWTVSSKEDLGQEELVQFMMRRIDSIIGYMKEANDYFLDAGNFPYFNEQLEEQRVSKQQLIALLSHFQTNNANSHPPTGEQYLQFLIEEFQSATPRIYLIEAITSAFNQAFAGTPVESDAQVLVAKLWHYIDQLKIVKS